MKKTLLTLTALLSTTAFAGGAAAPVAAEGTVTGVDTTRTDQRR